MFKNYLSLVKFSHTIFALPFALVGYFLAVRVPEQAFNWKILLFVVLCMVLARNAAMAFNRYVDRHIDSRNPRTAFRELPAGVIKPGSALQFVIINSILFIGLTWFINELVFLLSPLALLIILGYSFSKKFTVLCHFVLGMGLSLAPVGAYLSVTGQFVLPPLLLSGVVFFWVSGFDIIYALQDDDFDKQENLKSIPVKMGRGKALVISWLLHVVSAGFVFSFGLILELEWIYWAGAVIFIGLLVFQHFMVKPYDLSRLNLAFFSTNGVAAMFYALFTIIELWL